MATPFYSAKCSILGMLYYFRSRADADAFRDIFGGYVLQTSPPEAANIWRVTIK